MHIKWQKVQNMPICFIIYYWINPKILIWIQDLLKKINKNVYTTYFNIYDNILIYYYYYYYYLGIIS